MMKHPEEKWYDHARCLTFGKEYIAEARTDKGQNELFPRVLLPKEPMHFVACNF
jgi:hypothetical protein